MKPGGRHGEAGLTATELTVVSAILVALAFLVYSTFRYDSQALQRQTSQNVTQATLRIWAARMHKDMRRACFNPTDASPNPFGIVAATPTEFRFNVDAGSTGVLDTSDAASNVGYALDGTDLELWQSGSSWRVVLQGITSLQFAYYNSQGAQVNTISPYTSIAEINEVEVTLSAESETGGAPGAPAPVITEHFRVTLRNQC